MPANNRIKELDRQCNPLEGLSEDILTSNTLEMLQLEGTLIKKLDVTKLINLKTLYTDERVEVLKGENQSFQHFTDRWDYND